MTVENLSGEEGTPAIRADLFHRLIAGAPGCTTSELHTLYDALAPLIYKGTTVSPSTSRRWRREHLTALLEAEKVDAVDTPRGRVWVPLELPGDLEVRHVAGEARDATQTADVQR